MPSLPAATLPAALLCDMDGTLVDTEHQWLATVAAFLREQGVPAGEEVLTAFAGSPVDAAAERLVREHGVGDGRRPYERLLDREFTARVAAGRHRAARRPAAAGPGPRAGCARRAGHRVRTACRRSGAAHARRGPLRAVGDLRRGAAWQAAPGPLSGRRGGPGRRSRGLPGRGGHPDRCGRRAGRGLPPAGRTDRAGHHPGPRTSVVASLEDVDLADFPFTRAA